MADPVEPFPDHVVDEIAKAIGHTQAGLSGTDISGVFDACRIEEVSDGETTKWRRIANTFKNVQRSDRSANQFCAFIKTALHPARWARRQDDFGFVRDAVNVQLAFRGLTVTKEGQLHRVQAAENLDQAHERVDHLRDALRRRGVHAEVLRHVTTLVVKDQNYFHAVQEAIKGLGERIRVLSGFDDDGDGLVRKALEEKTSFGYPLVAFNRYVTATEQSEHRGLANLIRGLFLAFRNPTAHESRTEWPVSEADALDVLSLVSLLHRRLDDAHKTS